MQPFTKNLGVGSFGLEVARLQRLLSKLKYGNFIATGYYGPKTKDAVTAFQKKYGIDPIGYFGPLTQAKLNEVAPRETLYVTALSFIGRDASPDDINPDEVACAESVYDVLSAAFPGNVGFPFTASTNYMLHYMLGNPKLYKVVAEAQQGDIFLCATGEGNGGPIKNGHVGIWDTDAIISNNSANGIFDKHLDHEKWRQRYIVTGGYPQHIIRRIA